MGAALRAIDRWRGRRRDRGQALPSRSTPGPRVASASLRSVSPPGPAEPGPPRAAGGAAAPPGPGHPIDHQCAQLTQLDVGVRGVPTEQVEGLRIVEVEDGHQDPLGLFDRSTGRDGPVDGVGDLGGRRSAEGLGEVGEHPDHADDPALFGRRRQGRRRAPLPVVRRGQPVPHEGRPASGQHAVERLLPPVPVVGRDVRGQRRSGGHDLTGGEAEQGEQVGGTGEPTVGGDREAGGHRRAGRIVPGSWHPAIPPRRGQRAVTIDPRCARPSGRPRHRRAGASTTSRSARCRPDCTVRHPRARTGGLRLEKPEWGRAPPTRRIIPITDCHL